MYDNQQQWSIDQVNWVVSSAAETQHRTGDSWEHNCNCKSSKEAKMCLKSSAQSFFLLSTALARTEVPPNRLKWHQSLRGTTLTYELTGDNDTSSPNFAALIYCYSRQSPKEAPPPAPLNQWQYVRQHILAAKWKPCPAKSTGNLGQQWVKTTKAKADKNRFLLGNWRARSRAHEPSRMWC